MRTIHVHTPFTLQHNDESRAFAVGSHAVEDDVAEHWYVKAHTGEKPEAATGAEAAAGQSLAEQRAKLDDDRQHLNALHEMAKTLRDEQEAKAKALAAREDAARKREADLDDREKAVAEREDTADQRDVSLLAREKAVTEREQAAEKAAAEAAAKGSKAK